MNFPFLLTDSQWQIVSADFEPKARKRKVSLQIILSGVLYLLQTGCQWRKLPDCYGKWENAYAYFRSWSERAVLDGALYKLLGRVRQAAGRAAEPSAVVVDTQSIKTAPGVSREVGYDANKKVKGRKKSIATDTLGNPVAVAVGPASCHDKKCVQGLREELEDLHRLSAIYADGAFRGKPPFRLSRDIEWKVVEKKGGPFKVLPKRWVVERTFAWLMNFRRLVRDYEKLEKVARALIVLACVSIMLNKLTT